MKNKNHAVEDRKDEFRLQETIVIDGETTNLVVDVKLNRVNATYKITSALTTKQVHPTNDAINAATLELQTSLKMAAIKEAEIRRLEILRSNRDLNDADPTLPFGDDDEPEGAFQDNTDEPAPSADGPLTKPQKEEVVVKALADNPDMSDRNLARKLNEIHGEGMFNHQFISRTKKSIAVSE